MIKTNTFVKTLLEKGMVDDVAFLSNGYDIQVNGKLTSVRFNNKGGALIWNHKSNQLFNIESGRLDDVLHRYIVKSCFGTQTKTGVHGIVCKDTTFVPTKVINNCVIFEDALENKYVIKNTTPDAILSYFKEANTVNADSCMILLNGFEKYSAANRREIKSSVEDKEVELQLLKCSVNIDDYAVAPKSELINNVGQTIVGNFLCSSADKLNYMTFEEDENKYFMGNSRKVVKSSTIRSKNPLTSRVQVALNDDKSKQIVNNYLNTKYPYGLCLKAVESALAYEGPSIFKAVGCHDKLSYDNVFNHYCSKAEVVSFRLDSNKSILSAVEVPGVSSARFRAVPDVEALKNALYRCGYTLKELESGISFDAKEEVVASIKSACMNFVPVSEAVVNAVNTVSRMNGVATHKALESFGINDENRVFNSMIKVVLN